MADKIAIVTGAASGIGRAVAELFAERGARVVAVDIDPAGQGAARDIESQGGVVSFVQADLTDAADCEAVASAALELHGGIDALINCAGVIRRAAVTETSESDWDRVMAVNVKSVFLLSREVIPLLAQRGGGAIVNVASGWGLAAGPRAAAYCASKGAVVQLTRAMAIDHARQDIRVNCVCPGDVDTPMLRQEAAELDWTKQDFLRDAAQRPAERVGAPAEIAETIWYLAGDRAAYVTGIALVVDGGGLLA
jgi:NAD(P)-dependent dehydrogenase (short-subunit alcohol dehydrogenase family)